MKFGNLGRLNMRSLQITLHSIMAFYIGRNLRPATSPSDRHLGHYKAIINDPKRKKEAHNENYVSKHKLDYWNCTLTLSTSH
jgi:hypothetical protein